jgi:hypothetical protein
MGQSPSWEAHSHSPNQRIPQPFRENEGSLSGSQSPPLGPILSQIHPVYTVPLSPLLQGFRNSLLHSDVPTKILYAVFMSLMCATCPAHHIFLDLIILIIFVDAYKLWSSSLCSLLHPPATSSQLGPNILLSTLFSNTLDLSSSLS